VPRSDHPSGGGPASPPDLHPGAKAGELGYRLLLENLPEALLVQELDGRIIDANQAAADLYGYERDELIGMAASATAADLDPGRLERSRSQLLATGRYTFQGVGVRSDGSTFPQEISITRVPLADRDVAFVLVRNRSEERRLEAELASLTDLARLHETSRNSLEEVARRALDLSRRALSADRAAVGAFTRDGRVDWLASHEMDEFISAVRNVPSAEQVPWLPRILAGGTAEFIDRRAPGHETSMISPLADRMGMAAYAVLPLRAGEELTGAMGLVWSGEAPEQARNLELLNAIGRLVGMAFANVRLRASLEARQRALDESEARYRTLFDAAPEAMLIETTEGRIVDANAAASRLYGYARKELINLGVTEVADLTREQQDEVLERLRREGRGVWRGTERRRDGSTFPSEVEIALTRIAGEERLIVSIRDLTDQERLQGELLQAQKMEAIGQLVSGVAHELNNPLSAIIAFSQLIRRDPELPAELHHDADLLMQEADRTRRIVQNLLDFARQRPPERRAASVPQLVERTLELQAYALGAGRIAVDVDLPEDLPPVDVDPSQIQQVLLNLTMNAIHALRSLPGEGHLEVRAALVSTAGGVEAAEEPPGKPTRPAATATTGAAAAEVVAAADDDARPRVRIWLSDDGPGVPEPARSRLFEPFFTTKGVGEGTGLGLSVSYGIVASHGGRLWYEPRPGGGSTFVVELPAAAASTAEAPVAPAPSGRRRRGGVVLVVDDEPSIRTFLERALEKAGHDVTTAADGERGLEQIRRSAFDVVLCDHRMGVMDGLRCVEEALVIRPELRDRIVIMSGDVLNPVLREFADGHGVRVLAKPFDLDLILSTVDEVIDQEPLPA
jgi:PAS domain S-box-containing protein